MSDFHDKLTGLIEKCGSQRAFAQSIGYDHAAVYYWLACGYVTKRVHDAIYDRHGVSLEIKRPAKSKMKER